MKEEEKAKEIYEFINVRISEVLSRSVGLDFNAMLKCEESKEIALKHCDDILSEISMYKGGINPVYKYYQKVKNIIETKY